MTQQLAVTLRIWSHRPVLQDAAPAFAILTICALVNDPNAIVRQMAGNPADDGQIVLWWVATTFAVAGVALRRRRPLPMLAVCTLSAVTHVAQAMPLMIVDLGVPILLCTVAARYGRAVSLAALAGLLLLATGWSLYYALATSPARGLPEAFHAATTLPVGPVTAPPAGAEGVRMVGRQAWNAWSGLPVLGSALVASWAIGSGSRSRRAYLDELHAHAQDLERERDQQAVLAVAAERGRISRELHDVVAHGLSVMVIQAQGGAAALDNRPADTRTALEAIVKTGRDSLADMRRVLAAVGEVDDAWHPQPRLAQLSTLLTQVRRAGTPVRLHVEGTPTALPSTVDLSAYRIVQEALTNTMKHAGTGAKADVVLSYGEAEVGIEVSDDGQGLAGNDGGGNGLRGMRERVRLLDGRLATGPGPRSGFVVRAALPIQGRDA
ncbi:signal transduction histidine kinase [Streptosporangium album]|uniref:histidine kinase n=1 Tax=Streptosporangium album TaxID=47479 RepID=A0A7W7WDE0_9ACTN|nr:sensor histidine kinase [Streptosporangium album]MBB4943617.1 signal transduction histidine kinase [Streptosporangium album]